MTRELKSVTSETLGIGDSVDRSLIAVTLQWILLIIALVRLWIVPLPSSFWVDELVTVFVVQHPNHPSFAVAPQVPASIYYWLPKTISKIFGTSEIVYRLPSVILMGIALFLIARLAQRLIHPGAGWFAVFACLGLHGINDYADDARPYALGIFVAAGALLFLVRWLDSMRWWDGALFVLFAASLWAVHLIYWPMYLVFAFYAILRVARNETPVRLWQAAAAFGVVTLAVIPQVIAAVSLLHNATSHVVAELPGIRQFQHAIRWNLAIICGGSALLVSTLLKWPKNSLKWANSSWMLIWAWWLAQPICLYLFSHFTGNSVFVERYLSISLPGTALTATLAASIWVPKNRWRVASIALGVGVLIAMGQWGVANIRHGHSDWRGAALEERRLATSPDMPLICPSPFIEAKAPVWYPSYPLPGFLYAHLSGYPVTGKVYTLPFGEFEQDGEAYAQYLVKNALKNSDRFEIYGATKFWERWFAARPELAGWGHRREPFGDVLLVVFYKSPIQPPK